jgi:hypothetical protein
VNLDNDCCLETTSDAFRIASRTERDRIIELLIDLGAIRRDALGLLCAFNTEGTEVIYLPGLEPRE